MWDVGLAQKCKEQDNSVGIKCLDNVCDIKGWLRENNMVRQRCGCRSSMYEIRKGCAEMAWKYEEDEGEKDK